MYVPTDGRRAVLHRGIRSPKPQTGGRHELGPSSHVQVGVLGLLCSISCTSPNFFFLDRAKAQSPQKPYFSLPSRKSAVLCCAENEQTLVRSGGGRCLMLGCSTAATNINATTTVSGQKSRACVFKCAVYGCARVMRESVSGSARCFARDTVGRVRCPHGCPCPRVLVSSTPRALLGRDQVL
jgi:hypothetical protein